MLTLTEVFVLMGTTFWIELIVVVLSLKKIPDYEKERDVKPCSKVMIDMELRIDMVNIAKETIYLGEIMNTSWEETEEDFPCN